MKKKMRKPEQQQMERQKIKEKRRALARLRKKLGIFGTPFAKKNTISTLE